MARSDPKDPFNKRGFRQRARVRGRELLSRQKKRKKNFRKPSKKVKK